MPSGPRVSGLPSRSIHLLPGASSGAVLLLALATFLACCFALERLPVTVSPCPPALLPPPMAHASEPVGGVW